LFPYVYQESNLGDGTPITKLLYSKDVNRLVMYEPTTAFSDINDSKKDLLYKNSLLPNYDNYRANAQGISGSISPTILKEIPLADTNLPTSIAPEGGHYFSSQPLMFMNYNFPLLAQEKIYFEFENSNSSFLRIDRTNISRDIVAENTSTWEPIQNAKRHAKTSNSGLYNESVNSEGFQLKTNNRKRTGRFIETFTNHQIRTNNGITGFIEAKNLDRSNTDTYKYESIGGFRVTDIDGKTYHYSLPVINYQTWYKNYNNLNNEDGQFVLKENATPYATDWLLTAVTGSDYVDSNNNGLLDSQDFGYWVEFDYGKWSDGYVWKGSSVVKGEVGQADRYEYYMGRKQIYYLDAVKTRTHTAYFIKSLRQDAESQNVANYTTKLLPGQSFNKLTNSKIFYSAFERWYCLQGNCAGIYGAPYLTGYTIPTIMPNSNQGIGGVKGFKMFCSYADIPKNQSLKLEKIILINNNKDVTISKSNGTPIIEQKTGYLYEDGAFLVTMSIRMDAEYTSAINGVHFTNPLGSLKSFTIHQSQNIIDKNDVVNLNLESVADKVINFNYDYSLMLNSKNSSSINKGKLSLLDVQFLGSTGVSLMPKYKFAYNKSANFYNENVRDGWGYHNVFPQNASLIEINTPLGSKINIDYESDDYNRSLARTSIQSTFGKGGGIRVKEIRVNNQLYSETYKTKYYYNKLGSNNNASTTNYISSGEVSFIPSLNNIKIPYASEIPPPIVLYNNVSVQIANRNDELLSRTDYEFEGYGQNLNTPNNIYSLGNKLSIIKEQDENSFSDLLNFSKYNIKSKLSNLGRLNSIKSYNALGQLLQSTKNNYKEIQDSDTDYGVKQESFFSKSVKKISPSSPFYHAVNSISTIFYPSNLISTSSTSDGITQRITYEKSDFLTSQTLESGINSSDGKSFKTKVVPAYTKYAVMGSKVDNINNKNMLSQTAAEYSYILDNGLWKETGVGITTWNNVWSYKDIGGNTSNPANEVGVWRKHKTYTWNGAVDANGIFTNYNNTNNDDDGFVWGVGLPQTNTRWKQISEVTLYDHYSMALEAKDINDNKASIKMGDNDTKIMATGNAGYNEMFYAGGENNKSVGNINYLEPEVTIDLPSMRTNTSAHTGSYSIETNPNQNFGVVMKSGQHKSGKYKLNVWVRKNEEANARVNINGVISNFNATNETVTAGNWVLKTHYFTAQNNQQENIFVTSSSGSVFYDDLMIRPVASSITGYVYDQWDQLTYIIGNNGLATRFFYDNAGRLTETWVEVVDDPGNSLVGGFIRKSRNEIHYKISSN
jgi:hypothetical protein